MDFDDLDEVAPVAENKQPPTGTVLEWTPRSDKLPGLVNSVGRLSEAMLKEFDPPARAALTERSQKNRPTTAKVRLLCVHGVADSFEQSWFKLEIEAPPEIEVVVHEFPGHGRRERETVPNNLRELVEDVYEVLREPMETGSFALLGHSIGCLIITEIAKRALAELNVKPVAVFMVERGACQYPLFTPKGRDALRDLEFSISLDLAGAGDKGLDVKEWDIDGGGGKDVVLMVAGVSGLLEAWNAANPSKEVRFKDEVVRVNGIEGSASTLLAEINKALGAAGDGAAPLKLDLMRRPYDFLELTQPHLANWWKSGPNRTLLRWARTWCIEGDTLEVGYHTFTCPLLAFSAEGSVEGEFDPKDLDPVSKAIVDFAGKTFNKALDNGKVFMGHFPRETFEAWRQWTENTEGFKVLECQGADHMSIKEHRLFKRTVFDTLMDLVKLWSAAQ